MQTIYRLKPRRSLVVILGLIFSLIFLELFLRALGFVYLFKQDFKNFHSLGKKPNYIILALGESTTQGGGNYSWPSKLEDILNKKNIGTTFKVINRGRSGANTYRMLTDLRKNIDIFHPDMVITMIGINDNVPGLPDIDPVFAVNVYNRSQNPILSFLDNFKVFKLSKLIFVSIQQKFKRTGFFNSSMVYAIDQVNRREAVNSYLNKGNEYIEEKKYQDAINAFEQAIKLDPAHERAYQQLSYIYNGLGESDKVINIAQRFLLLDPSSSWAYIVLAQGYANSGKTDQADATFKEALRLNPDDLKIYIEYSNQLRLLQRYEEFAQLMEAAVQRNPDNPQAYTRLAESYRYLGKHQGALEAINRALSLDPDNNLAKVELSNIYRQTDETDQSTQVLGINTEVEDNYREIKNVVLKKGLKFVAVQYPVISIEPLKRILGDDNVIYVDNEKIFKDALKVGKYEDYFVDRFAGSFGHATRKGNELLASNIAQVILREIFRIATDVI